MTAPGSAGTASDGYRTDAAPHTCPAGPDDYGLRRCACLAAAAGPCTRRITTTSLRPVDSSGRRRDTTNEGDER